MSLRIPVPLLLLLALAVPPGPAAAGGPTMAREDTMSTEVPPVLVSAPRVTLDEILDRVARGEARRDSMMTDQSFVATLRVVSNSADPKKPPVVERETVVRVWKKKPDRVRSVTLRDVRARKRGARAEADVRFRGSMGEEVVNFAFQPSARRDYRYRIVGRDLLEGPRLVYRVAFEPRSRLDPALPSGLVWIDTNDFVIVRQEVVFERSPAPLFLRGIRRMVVERQRADGFWVLRRVLLRAEATMSLPGLGRTFDFSITHDGFVVNRGVPDSVFAGLPRGGRGAEGE
jgi:hypothetical protein